MRAGIVYRDITETSRTRPREVAILYRFSGTKPIVPAHGDRESFMRMGGFRDVFAIQEGKYHVHVIGAKLLE